MRHRDGYLHHQNRPLSEWRPQGLRSSKLAHFPPILRDETAGADLPSSPLSPIEREDTTGVRLQYQLSLEPQGTQKTDQA